MPPIWNLIVGLCTILTVMTLCGRTLAQVELTPAQVQQGIDRAVQYLISMQRGDDGGWPEVVDYDLGASSLATLALLSSGMSPDSPAIQRALNYITTKELNKTYTVSLQTMALCAANPNRYAPQIQRNATWLMTSQSENGGWGYGNASSGTDPSNSQFALLALHEVQRVGVSMNEQQRQECFEAARQYWLALQADDGSFSYSGGAPSGSMTAAGIASLIIVGSQSDQLQASAVNAILCCGQERGSQQRIQLGLNWLASRFSVHTNPLGSQQHYLYYMYAVERVGRLAGLRYFTGPNQMRIDWYREGALALLRMQNESGSFGTTSYGNEVTEVAFGLLFLAKGKRQVVVNRLEYGQSQDWNQHPLSTQHLVAHTEQAWKRDLAWQIVRLEKARVADLMEAPVLFISGRSALNLSQDHKKLLKEFVEQQGGFIFAEACHGDGCQGAEFEKYFQDLVVELFQQPLEKLSPDHPLWSAQAQVLPKDLPSGAWLYGVQTCCRLGIVYCPYSLSCRWELNLPYGNRANYSASTQSDIETATKLGINVLTYASGKELKQKLDSISVLKQVVKTTPTERGVFVLPILNHNAGADDAPRAAKTLIQWLNQENPFQMSSEKRVIPISSDQLQLYPVGFMHGRGVLKLDEQQRQALRDHFAAGGFLICNAICGDVQFADSFRQEMQQILGQPLTALDASHPLFSNNYQGFDLKQVSVMDPTRAEGGQIVAMTRRSSPIIEAGYAEGRMVVAFSPLDMSCALESRHSLQCKGYVREDAARLGINLILFGLQQ